MVAVVSALIGVLGEHPLPLLAAAAVVTALGVLGMALIPRAVETRLAHLDDRHLHLVGAVPC